MDVNGGAFQISGTMRNYWSGSAQMEKLPKSKSTVRCSPTEAGCPERKHTAAFRRPALIAALSLALLFLGWKAATFLNWNPRYRVGQEIDKLNGVPVFYNGGIAHSSGRNLASDGYNLGIRYQCVEFVKRYYYEHLHHRMPDTYGHARQFFDASVPDGGRNTKRDLQQYRNGGQSQPRPDDLLVFGPSVLNRYGHVAIVSAVTNCTVEIVQQNPGPFGRSRELLPLRFENGGWRCGTGRVLGWLRKETQAPGRS